MEEPLIGSRLGPYSITAKLGEGGMGEVYRATDTKLERQVAIMVLPAAFTADPERLARFEREAKLLAQLNHPNIVAIHGLEESDGVRALVMELVEGPTLAERLEQGPLPFNESLSVSLQIAQALEEAHEKGIVHRDLKPQDIKASIEGKVKVLDFGLAKAMDPTAGSAASAADMARSPTLMRSPTLTAAHGTQLGMILGTAAYMSPEQARGVAVDKRADIWAFGVVLYEMLVGRKLFEAETLPETLGAICRQEIDLAELPASTPPRLRRLVERCLERDPKRRLRHRRGAHRARGDRRRRDRGASTSGGSGRTPPWGLAPDLRRRAAGGRGDRPSVVARVDRTGAEIARFGEPHPHLARQALSPDGARLALVLNNSELWVRDLGRGAQTRLVTEAGELVEDPQWTRDGRTIYYTVGNSSVARRVRAEPGATPETVFDDAYPAFLAPDGSGVLIRKGSFRLDLEQGFFWAPFDAQGRPGERRKILGGLDSFGRLAPDARMLAYGEGLSGRREAFLTTFPAADQTIQLSSNGGGTPQWSADGKAVYYLAGGALIEVEVGFDAAGRLTASPERRLFELAKVGLRSDGWSTAPDGNGFLLLKSLASDNRAEIVVARNGLQRAKSAVR